MSSRSRMSPLRRGIVAALAAASWAAGAHGAGAPLADDTLDGVTAGTASQPLASGGAVVGNNSEAVLNITGTLDLGFDASGWVWLGCAALVSTVLAVVLFFSGMSRVGPSTAAILSTLEPPVTVALVFVTFGEALGAVQILGALAVLGAAVVVNLPSRAQVVTVT